MKFWAVVPAAGRGERMGTAGAKQYAALAGRSVIEWSIAPLLSRSECRCLVVVLAAEDRRFASLAVAADARIRYAIGGSERSDSVRAGLHAIAAEAGDQDWVLVHDAARPCVSDAEIDLLLSSLRDDAVGGLLARPVVDTLKRGEADRVQATVPRANLWRALTPQMFRYGILCEALRRSEGQPVTDEAQAIERLGLQPRLVMGSEDNLKITYADDLVRAERVLNGKAVGCGL